MSPNASEPKTSAPLISMRRSFYLRTSGILMMGIGMWVVIGVFGLFGHAISASLSSGWSYLMVILVMLPTTLSFVELRSWVGHSGGSYRLIRAMERNHLTFFAGWAYILGWAGISALLVQSFAMYTSQLVMAAFPVIVGQKTIEILLGLGLMLLMLAFFTISNITGTRPPWRAGIWIVSGAMVTVGTLALILLAKRIRAPLSFTPLTTGGGGGFFTAVMILIASQWVIELLSEAGGRRHRTLRTTLLLSSAGAAVGGLMTLIGTPWLKEALALANTWQAPDMMALPALAEIALPGVGQILILAIGALVTAIAWQILALIMLRRFQVIGLAGWMPQWLLRSYTRFNTPVVLILGQMLMTVLGLLIGTGLASLPGGIEDTDFSYAAIAAMIILLLQIGVNVAAITLGKHPRAADRSFRLPLYPIIPAVGAAVNFLLLLTIPWQVLLVGGIWFAIGALFYWRVALDLMRDSQLGRTVFQDVSRHQDITSDFPVVVPVSNPDTALNLVAFGAAIAQYYGGHVSVVQIELVPDHLPLDSGRYQARQKLDLLERVLQDAEQYAVPVEGITRLSRSVSQGILDTIAEESARLVVLGWTTPQGEVGNQSLGNIVNTVLENAPCDVAVIRGEWDEPLKSALVPIAGGPHASRAAELALALTAQRDGKIVLLNVVQESASEEAVRQRQTLLDETRNELSAPGRATTHIVRASAPLPGIVKAAEDYDIVFLGATESGLLGPQYFGQLPMQYASQSEGKLALFRSYTGLTTLVARRAWQGLSGILPTLTPWEQTEVSGRLRQSARPNVNYFVLITLSAVIATLGLLLNSPAVIIGAMLVAPLMTPIVAAALGMVYGDIRTLRDALTSTLQGVLGAIFIAILAALLSPIAQATPEVLARTQPNLLDLMVALVSGMAGAYAIARQEVGEALPGVAIAAALMPPVCTIGIGISLGSIAITLGSTLLFVTNLVAIIFGAAIVFLLLGMRPPQRADNQRWLIKGLTYSIVSLVVLSIPLGVVLFRSAEQGRVEILAQTYVQEAVAEWPNVTLDDLEISMSWRTLDISGTLHTIGEIPEIDIAALEDEIGQDIDYSVDIELVIIQGTLLDGEAPPTP